MGDLSQARMKGKYSLNHVRSVNICHYLGKPTYDKSKLLEGLACICGIVFADGVRRIGQYNSVNSAPRRQ
jgi:hypothetical protein